MTAGTALRILLASASLWVVACGGEGSEPVGATAGTTSVAPVTAAGSGAGSRAEVPSATAGRAAPTAPTAGSATANNPAGAGATATPPPATASAGAPAQAGSGAPPAAGSVGAPAAAGSGAPTATAGAAGSAPAADTAPHLYWLDINSNRVMHSSDFKTAQTLVARTGTAPDGVAVDVAGGKIYWTNMGSLLGTGGGTLQRANLDGSNVETIVPAGVAQTPKQMQLDLTNKHVYWCDREGAKVFRAGLDGSNPEAIVSGHGYRELVGVALDVPAGKFYFSDRIGRKIVRGNIQMPAGETGANRTDLEEQVVFTGSAMPIDLDIDHTNKYLYWTDRDLGTVHRAQLEMPAGSTASTRTDAKTIVMGLSETIGISLDVPNNKMYFTELGGQVSESALDGSGVKRGILRSGSATGVAIAHLPK